jgi:adenylate cyclase
MDLSGVEIHATALANLLTQTTLRPVGPVVSFVTLAFAGGAFGGIGYWVRTWRRRRKAALSSRVQASVVIAGLAITYCAVVYRVFLQSQVLLPLVVPVAVQVPAALILALLAPAARHREQVYAVCLATDAAGSTAIGQRLPHGPYAHLMTSYHRALSSVVAVGGGEPLPPQGDGFIALWWVRDRGHGSEAGVAITRLQACRTALAVVAAAERFNRDQPAATQLPTRIGLNLGAVTIHSDADRGVFEAFGDVVNVAARLRDLNVRLGTRILASGDVVRGLDPNLAFDKVEGRVSLKGVEHPPDVVEIVCPGSHMS